MYIYVYTYIYIYTYSALRLYTPSSLIPRRTLSSFMCGLYYHFNNLRFKHSQHINESSGASDVIICVSSDDISYRSLKWLLDHPTDYASTRYLLTCRAALCHHSSMCGLYYHFKRPGFHKFTKLNDFPIRTSSSCL